MSEMMTSRFAYGPALKPPYQPTKRGYTVSYFSKVPLPDYECEDVGGGWWRCSRWCDGDYVNFQWPENVTHRQVTEGDDSYFPQRIM